MFISLLAAVAATASTCGPLSGDVLAHPGTPGPISADFRISTSRRPQKLTKLADPALAACGGDNRCAMLRAPRAARPDF